MELYRVLRQSVVDRLFAALATKEGRDKYSSGKFGILPIESIPFYGDQKAKLNLVVRNPKDRAADDLDNAIKLYDSFKDLNETQASDERLWAYLSHTALFDYTVARWPIPSGDEQKKATFIAEHWFCRGGDRSLRRNALSRLWWTVHLTKSPWEDDPFFKDLESKDPYRFTRILLGKQDIFQQTLERSFCRDRRILISLLDVFRQDKKLADSRKSIRLLLKQLNIGSGFHVPGILEREPLKQFITERVIYANPS